MSRTNLFKIINYCFHRWKVRWWHVNFRRLVMAVVIFSFFQLLHNTPAIYAKEKLPKIAMVYMTSDDLPNADVYFLEATLSAFADEMLLVSASKIDPATIQQSDVIVFVGNEPGIVPQSLKEVIQQYKGDIIAFGHNVEQLPPYDELAFSRARIYSIIG